MSSNVVPQAALLMVPRNPTPPPKKLNFCAFLSRRSTASFSLSVSGVSTSSFDSLLGVEKLVKNRSFIVRAEEEGIAEAEPAEEAAESEAEPEAEGEGEGEAETEAERTPAKPRIKLGDIMGILNKKAIEASDEIRPTPDIRTGDVVEIKLEVPENRRRLSVYKGIVISKQNAGIHTTIRICRIIAGIGVEIVFPLYSPNIKEIRVLSHRKVRRARLYYLREKLPSFSTFK